MSENFAFNPQTEDFDINNAYSLARVSQLVYTRFEDDEETRKRVIEIVKDWGFTELYFLDHTAFLDDSQAIVLADAEKIIIGFRGTEPTEIEDWARDLQIIQIKRLNGRVHRGFFGTFNTLWTSKLKIWKANQEIEQKFGLKYILEELLTANKRPIFVTGHSLGGAMAALGAAACALELKESFDPKVSLYTYGQPRVGDDELKRDFLKNINSRAFRIVNNNDIVARIPIDLVKMVSLVNYTHVGKLIYLDTESQVHVKELGLWARKQDQLKGRFEDLLKPGSDGIKDHDLSKYISILKGALDDPKKIIT